MPFAPASFGITRLADQTGLDELGIPVWTAIRPGARSFSVANGKGWTHEAAALGAAMEAVEGAASEAREALSVLSAPLDGVAAIAQARGLPSPLPDLRPFRHCMTDRLDASLSLDWVPARPLDDGEDVLVPFALAGLDLRAWHPEHRAFCMNSIGIAAHLDCERAVLHGLLEVIENDALSCAYARPDWLRRCPRLPRPEGPDRLVEALDRLCEARLEAVFLDVTTDFALPTALALIVPLSDDLPLHSSAGVACRGDWPAAMEAAFLEAAQSRVTQIAGARDDLLPYVPQYRPQFAAIAPPTATGWDDRPGPGVAIDRLVALCRDVVGTAPLVVDLFPGHPGLSVVRALLPQAETCASNPGLRATRAFLGRMRG